MLGEGSLTFREFAMGEPVPLAVVHESVLGFLRDRDDAVVFGAQAVNAYVDVSRMTQDVDICSTRGKQIAAELQQHLAEQFHIAVRVREIGEGAGYRVYQLTKPKNRHLVDIRQVDGLPASQRIDGVLVVTPIELLASKVLAYCRRKGKPKAGTDCATSPICCWSFPI
ncbi:MAG: hypothetical protein KDA57_02280 [Planctomycetales bacterium]|nr:hypothetical protein [Planctomycetales bacterium]